MFLPTVTKQFFLLSYWLAAGIWAQAALKNLLRITQKLFKSLWAFPSGFPKPFISTIWLSNNL